MSIMDAPGFDQLTERTGLPAQTLRRYAKEFARWLPTRKVGRVVKFQSDAPEIIEAIRAAFEQGKTTPEVRDLLAAHVPPVLDVPGDPPAGETTPTTIPTTPPMTVDPATLAAVLPLAERWVAALERQNELQARTLAAMEARLAVLESLAARTPQDAPQPAKRTKVQTQAETPKNGPPVASLLPRSRAEIVGEVLRLREEGLGYKRIATSMTRAEWPTLSGRGGWDAGVVKYILRQEGMK